MYEKTGGNEFMKKYQFYNLSQKMIQIRKRIPKLVKKRYSEDVDYDFVKIDDIYEFLTPALNKYGVDFDIVREVATQKDEMGNQIFLTQIEGMWQYEADVILRWSNADNPLDAKEVVLHVIGTHEVAEKAKGTAWTYGLKYYFLNRFNINQGGDDSDLFDYQSEPEKREQQEKKNGEGKERVEKKIETESKKGIIEKEATVLKKEQKLQEEKVTTQGEQQKQINSLKSEKDEKVSNKANPMDMEIDKKAENQLNGFMHIPDNEMEEMPFFDSDDVEREEKSEHEFLADLRSEIIVEGKTGEMTLEEAKKVVCNFGIYNGKTFGEMMTLGEKGWKGIRWIVNDYRGGDTKMKEAAKIILNHNNLDTLAA